MSKFPDPILETHENVLVVRDDLFPYGSKARFLDEYFSHIPEQSVVYGSSPRWGYAQISIAFLARRHNKRATVFIAKSNEYHEYTKRAMDLGLNVVLVGTGFLKVTEARARKYAQETGARLLPIGLDCPEALEGIRQVACGLNVNPEEVWTVASSGTLTRGLQLAWPKAKFFAVEVGRALDQSDVGDAYIIKRIVPFNKRAEKSPPFPSVPEYDAKAWRHIPKDGEKLRLFWNVGA